jgi:hypothetical protein
MEAWYVTIFLTFIWIKEGLYRRTVVTEDALAGREQKEQNKMQLAAEDPHDMICDNSLELVYKLQTTCNRSVSMRPLQIEEKEGVSMRPLQIEEKGGVSIRPLQIEAKEDVSIRPLQIEEKEDVSVRLLQIKEKQDDSLKI